VTDDGVPIDEKTWWIGRYVPSYADKIKTSYVAKAKGTTTDKGVSSSSLYGEKKDGKWDLGEQSTIEIGRQGTDDEGKTTTFKDNYVTAKTIDLQAIVKKPFPMASSTDVINRETGDPVGGSQVLFDLPTNANLIRVFKGDVTVPDPKTGKTITFKKGSAVRDDEYKKYDILKQHVEWDWFLTSASTLKKKQGEPRGTEDYKLKPEYEPTYNTTTLRRWDGAKDAIKQAVADKTDITEMINAMEEMKQQKNGNKTDAIFNDLKKEAQSVIKNAF
jgi:hypothetical protein